MSRSGQPVVFFAFANDRAEGGRYLRNLPEEQRRLRRAMAEAQDAGHCQVVERGNATVDEIFDVFQRARYRDRIAVFHFGGHAGSAELILETSTGRAAVAHAGGLAGFLGEQRGLALVFLNGCSSRGQVRGVLDAGVPAVIATSEAIADDVATDFSARFYQSPASGATVRKAFNEAAAAVRTDRSRQRDQLADAVADHRRRRSRRPLAVLIQQRTAAPRAGAGPRLARSLRRLAGPASRPAPGFRPELQGQGAGRRASRPPPGPANDLLTASGKLARLWDLYQSRLSATIQLGGDETVVSVDFSPDGDRILTANPNTVAIWTLVIPEGTRPVAR